MNVIRRLSKISSNHPTPSMMVLYAGLYGGAEISQQTISGRQRYDWPNIGRICVMAVGFYAPFNLNWYKILDRFLPGSSPAILVKKVFFDQAIAGTVGITAFYVGTGLMEGRSRTHIAKELGQKFAPTFKTACMFWPAVQCVNFVFLPTHMRAVYVGFAAFIWANFLCYTKGQKLHDGSH